MRIPKLMKAALGVSALVGANVLLDDLLVHRKFDLPDSLKDFFSGTDMSQAREMVDDYLNWMENYGYEIYHITNTIGLTLTGYLMRAKEPSNLYVFCAHGYRCNGKREFCAFVQYYLSRGINVFFVDHRASGESQGTYIGFGFYESMDCMQWLSFMKKTFGEDISLIIHGVSMGSATVMLMSGRADLPENVKLIVADCGFTSAWDEFEFKLQGMKIPVWPLLPIVNRVNRIVAGYDFKTDTDCVAAVRRAKVPMLFVHGSADGFVPCHMVYQLFSACASEQKQLLLVDGADHAASFVTDQPAYEAKLDEMINAFVRPAAQEAKN